MKDQKLLEKLLKIRELADRGVEGERESARLKLARIMAENDLTEDDLIVEDRDHYYFKFNDAMERMILFYVWRCVRGRGGSVQFLKYKGSKKISIEMTAKQAVEVRERFESLRAPWRKEKNETIDKLMMAFLSRNNLFEFEPVPDEEDGEDLSDEEKKLVLELFRMMKATPLPVKKIEI